MLGASPHQRYRAPDLVKGVSLYQLAGGSYRRVPTRCCSKRSAAKIDGRGICNPLYLQRETDNMPRPQRTRLIACGMDLMVDCDHEPRARKIENSRFVQHTSRAGIHQGSVMVWVKNLQRVIYGNVPLMMDSSLLLACLHIDFATSFMTCRLKPLLHFVARVS